ncbi:DUF1236 domain-containing protein [Methylobacterium nodulans]|uniref:Uncharacterized protein n=1 Tax=Methylobacterium nodulans (strain LMG 21967 / CNCM I-2342 / ORS 2060) TaxID=460265 RepID=B8IQC7_METNO|nr:DUF1236 domain-containing protein [Methylobacterium nodulans]ACL58627.1 protein of unknown function DUF1236 [Methylobacterium nodulans ORS 2060]
MTRIPSVAVALILFSSAAVAQMAEITTGSTGDVVEITSDQRALIKRHASQRHAHPIRLKRLIPAGSMVPDHVEFEPLPAAIIGENPRLQGYGYFLSETGIYIIAPGSRRVITSID